ncbi:MAG TPA: hypothetical protein VGM63_10795 [Mucilaginibacter sp.]|jgi:hypothetical protein
MRSDPIRHKLFFFIDESHFPEVIPESFNDPVIKNVDNRNTWYAWTIKTYLYLKDVFDCELTSKLPLEGIILYFRGSIGLSDKPTGKQFFICMVGDGTWHPYANINVFQNAYQSQFFENGFFMQHWLLLDIIPNSQPFGKTVPTISYFGDPVNLDPYLRSEEWFAYLEGLGFEWMDKSNNDWNNYENVDIIVAIRKFNSEIKFIQRPASKLINTWHGGAVPIMGNESAYRSYKLSDYDYLEADSIEALKKILLKLKTDTILIKKILENGKERSKGINNDIIKKEWIDFINGTAYPQAVKWFGRSFVFRSIYLLKRFILYRSNALINRFVSNVWLSKK